MSTLLELLKAKKQDLAAGKRRKTIKPAPGTGRYRILPSWRGAGQQFWHDFGQHFIKNSAKEITAIYMCTEKTFGRPCDVCGAISQGMKAASDDFTMELLKDATSTGRVLVNAIHHDGQTPNEVQILELPPTVFGMIVGIAEEWEEAGESIFDGTKGKDILITREGTGKNTKYTCQIAAKVFPLPAGADKLHNLDEYVAQESSAAQLRALNSVRAVSGLLAAPEPSAGPAGLPAAAAAAATIVEEDPYAVAAPPPRRAAAPAAAVEDVAPKPPKAVAAAPAAVAAAPAAAAPDTGDVELDDLLANLDK